jgi:tight adherence protein C
MSVAQVVFLVLVFCAAAGVVLAVAAAFAPTSVRRRVAELQPQAAAPQAGLWLERIAAAATPFMRLSLPEEGWEKSLLRVRFMHAGWRAPAARKVFFGAKTMLALALPLLVALLAPRGAGPLGRQFLLYLLAAASAGYYLPNALLERRRGKRRREIVTHFPDVLDLLTVCVEAGLSLDSALVRVAGEIGLKSVVLAQELNLMLMEMRAGFSKDKALRNFALRCGVDDVDTLVTMLIQAGRFGTGMGASLRIHADNLRVKRRQQAEEAAAKVALKLLFPLTFCVFPALLVVLVGPAAIQIHRFLLPAMAGQS